MKFAKKKLQNKYKYNRFNINKKNILSALYVIDQLYFKFNFI